MLPSTESKCLFFNIELIFVDQLSKLSVILNYDIFERTIISTKIQKQEDPYEFCFKLFNILYMLTSNRRLYKLTKNSRE